jgi:uncharacterized protein YdaU (DUF1376 family)
MAELPIMPLNWPALLADTSHMTAAQFGGYVRLLGAMWLHGGHLVENSAELARIAGISRTSWSKHCEAIMRPMTVKDGIVTQKRLAATLLNVQETRQRRAAAGHKRWTSKRKQPGYSRA